ncbi:MULTISPECIES: enoyl-CoA hydratase [Oceanobacillus]|uniref:Enoyl-CoA hydratase n=1 Tax=Oceanobacillus kimchii TaxID=746691 RepID=A0ABQ5TJL2_9BACI|nr:MULTISPECIES: enoyl-CoA hydratase [Oceanobacillus]MBT2598553.1 enoyl-CoA hydratase [Oceanobacillus sp. ISL-74]MBT2651471.1 enoyl-CoA hydratase [Oceanobacillus sp. ISL-73]MCT1576129.1 enoyl-CoA hydratase [Oceanobacillus kimchii]MCT2135766.1 enoyl-CoA hydratase [Oceanobacillus kimchii]OEH55858.1 enoyl-CoA hydratase [Oceanobacillus sp. E9]
MEYLNYEIVEKYTGIITLQRPSAANALSQNLLNEFNQLLDDIEQNKMIRCVIVTGAGTKAFCAGADLKERKGMSDDQVIQAVKRIGETINRIEKLQIPVIAAINGVALGGGLELALACDIRIAAENTKLGLTETSLAIIPGAGGTQRLPRTIGVGHAKRLIYSAVPITTEEALRLHLIERSVNEDKLIDEALQLAKRISSNGPLAVQLAKNAINNGLDTTLEKGLEMEHLSYQKVIPTQDRLEGLQAFAEKRKPDYQGR